MAYNLFVAYDLIELGQNYEKVRERIRSLGRWHQFQFSLFYVNTEHSPQAAFDIISRGMDANDKLAVINAESGVVSTGDRPPIAEINAIWFGS